jgi:hypothetical protein
MSANGVMDTCLLYAVSAQKVDDREASSSLSPSKSIRPSKTCFSPLNAELWLLLKSTWGRLGS